LAFFELGLAGAGFAFAGLLARFENVEIAELLWIAPMSSFVQTFFAGVAGVAVAVVPVALFAAVDCPAVLLLALAGGAEPFCARATPVSKLISTTARTATNVSIRRFM
jgi:hypothetical protein